jgi:hypothetical protein
MHDEPVAGNRGVNDGREPADAKQKAHMGILTE